MAEPGTQIMRAVQCADGYIHTTPTTNRRATVWSNPSLRLRIADQHDGQPGCGGAPHRIVEQTITASEWSGERR